MVKPLREIFLAYAEVVNGKHTNGTDKQTNHAYGDAYDSLLRRESITLMLEIGTADGSSLLAWQEALPNAIIVGMDIHPASKWKGEFHLGDQRLAEDCKRAAADRQFDLIVEDATHQLDATLLTLYHFWPFVKSGGLYIVEEWPNVDSRLITLFDAEIVDTQGPFGGIESLVVLRKR